MDQTIDPRAFAGLFGAVARGALEFVTESFRVGGAMVGDLGDLVANGADKAAGEVNDRVDRRFADGARTTETKRRASSASGGSLTDIVNRTIDGCVDVIESSVNTFERAYDRQRRADKKAAAAATPDAPDVEPAASRRSAATTASPPSS
jgi:hypothetical protein